MGPIRLGRQHPLPWQRFLKSPCAVPAIWIGTGGAVITHICQNSTSRVADGNGGSTSTCNRYNIGAAVAVQSNGKIVAAGHCESSGYDPDFCLARYNSDGSLDSSFGPGCTTHSAVPAALGCSALFDVPGIVVTDVAGSPTGGPANASDNATGIALQPDGHIVVVGYCQVGSRFEFCLARYNSDGSLAGTAVTVIGDVGAQAQAVAVQPDGKIVVVGYCGNGNSFCIARYNSDLSLDTSFDGDGTAFAIPFVNGSNFAFAVAIQSDGKIVAAGWCAAGVVCLARLDTNGSLDASFDGDGLVTTGANSTAYGVAVQSDGKIVVAGNCPSGHFCLTRFDSDGSLDATFGSAGTAAATFASSGAVVTAMGLQGDGKIVVAGYCYTLESQFTAGRDFCLARFDGGSVATNHPPVGLNDTYSANQGNELVVPVASGVLANDSDPDAGTTLSAILVGGPAHGALTLASNGSFHYTPVADYSGTDTFSYRASDGSLTSNLVTVTINVTGLPTIIDSQTKLTSGQKASLKDKLAAAKTLFSSGKLNAACGKLGEFITQVSGLTPSKLSSATATILINGANALKVLYGCPG